MGFPLSYRRAQAQSPRWRVTAEIARDLAAAAEERGASSLFVLIPASFQVYKRTFHEYVRGFGIDSTTVDIDQPSRLLREVLAVQGLCVVDALPAFRAAAAEGPRLFGTIDRHFSPAGHAVLADLIAPLAARLLVDAGQWKEPQSDQSSRNHPGSVCEPRGVKAPVGSRR